MNKIESSEDRERILVRSACSIATLVLIKLSATDRGGL
jgi:hypothetical protein